MSLKWLHVVSSVVLVGTGFGSAFHIHFTHRSGDVAAQAVVARLVVRADSWFTTPTVFVQPATGLAMAHLAGLPLATPWLSLSIGLFLLSGLCWLPVVWLQLRMAAMAREAARRGAPLPATCGRFMRCWEALGDPAFVAMLGVFCLMVAKPALWG